MTQAYDVKDLLEKLKVSGLSVAEESAKDVLEALVAWLQESATLSATPIDNIALVLLPEIKTLALATISKIDGK